MSYALVIGAGPAGLMAADALSSAGHRVIVAEAKPSPARKFLMAGKSGLNLTKDEPTDRFVSHFFQAAPTLRPMLAAFGPAQVQDWARALDQEIFTGSSGRVFPKAMKASPLLRAWLRRLSDQGVEIRTRWRWTSGLRNPVFDTPDGPQTLTPAALILACGGASWARLGSDADWVRHLPVRDLAPFQPANMGFYVDWSPHMEKHFGQPVKNTLLKAGPTHIRAEFVLTRRGVEGGGIYAVSRPLRQGAPLTLDLLPDLPTETIRARLSNTKQSLPNRLRRLLRDPVKQALVLECARPLPNDIAPLLKNLPLPVTAPFPMDEAISTAGGLRFTALTDGLMLQSHPGIFAAGEMLDWEAPTGGYLLTGCLATGKWAGENAARFLASSLL
ncbi:TIGR03862 family flavoprotein [Thalassobius sp. S69A]|uniref:TIGR03862 family flavoprotein n=1 Tax=unclassified Thalassovita TaxID=2619711 RepID=UPI000C0CE0C1|nr:aminoacetone oxidase family FAD-binding enzyme [Paracoccaceae bacterium]MBT27298.1 aminoacetone oxidase family FAD-binding enzyme [Paracoccaceae bacterium]